MAQHRPPLEKTDGYDSLSKVIAGGYCIGCGACATKQTGNANISFNREGFLIADIDKKSNIHAGETICPFSDASPNEDIIAKEEFGTSADLHPSLGILVSAWVGSVATGEFRANGSAGGFVSWLLVKALENGDCDGVIHVTAPHADSKGRNLCGYSISRTSEEIMTGAKSWYHPVEMSHVLEEVSKADGRFIFVGIPCFVKAVRLIAREHPDFRKKIVRYVGLFCGHLKSRAFAETISEEAGIPHENLNLIDFRTKLPGRPSNEYGVTVSDGQASKTIPKSRLSFGDWSLGAFKYKACDFCDDISAETADFSIGDAWLPEYTRDSRGTNIVIARSSWAQSIIQRGITDGSLHFQPISNDLVVKSQRANFRHRRDDLSLRLRLADDQGIWRPKTRTLPSPIPDHRRLPIIQERSKLRELLPKMWSDAKEGGTKEQFFQKAAIMIQAYRRVVR